MSGNKIHKTHFTQPEMPWRKNKEETVELKRERPIIFNAEMVRAILNGNKSQTRRVIKPQPKYDRFDHIGCNFSGLWMGWPESMDDIIWEAHCPYGKIGNQLWVRETWATPGNYDHIKPSKLLDYMFPSSSLKYRATEKYGDAYFRWRPSIHMPGWASRIQLEVLSVKVETVQDITDEDIVAEGGFVYGSGAWEWFIPLWNSINEKRGFGWDTNPWVWVVEFKVIEVKNGHKN